MRRKLVALGLVALSLLAVGCDDEDDSEEENDFGAIVTQL